MNRFYDMEVAKNQAMHQGAIGGQLGTDAVSQCRDTPTSALNLQALSAENTAKLRKVNQGLARLRASLFGEGECGKDQRGANKPMPSLSGSLCMANDELMEIGSQLDSIMARV